MGKVVRVKHSRKEYVCGRCLKTIEKGAPYLRGELNFSRPVIRCCECGLEPWEVTTSDYQLRAGEIVHRWHEHYEATEDGRDGIVSDLEEIKCDLEERLDSMPESLRDSDNGELLQSRIDSLDSAICDLEDIDFDDEEYSEDDYAEQIDYALIDIEI